MRLTKKKQFPMNKISCSAIIFFVFIYMNISNNKVYGYVFDNNRTHTIEVLSREITKSVPYWHSALYISSNHNILRSKNFISYDNGLTWSNHPTKAKFNLRLAPTSSRSHVTSLYIPDKDAIVFFVNAMDSKIQNLASIKEPLIGHTNYYIRYLVSKDKGYTYLFDKPIYHSSLNVSNPFPEVVTGRNSFYLGDIGSQPILSKNNKILLPVQSTVVDKIGKIWNPAGTSYTEVFLIIGEYLKNNTIRWHSSERIKISSNRSTRGLIEPSLVELRDGRLLMVMRGSNGGAIDKSFAIPGYKWYSISEDGGENWSEPKALKFKNSDILYSPSSMSVLFKHSTDRVFWIGNISEANTKGNNPRSKLAIVEVDLSTLTLLPETLLLIDSQKNVDLSHVHLIEDRVTKQVILTYPRNYHGYTVREWATVKIRVS